MLKEVRLPCTLIVKISSAIHRKERSATCFTAGMGQLHEVDRDRNIFDATVRLRAPERVRIRPDHLQPRGVVWASMPREKVACSARRRFELDILSALRCAALVSDRKMCRRQSFTTMKLDQ